MMQSTDRTNAQGSRQLRAVAGLLVAVCGLSLAAMIASCSSPSTQGKSISGLGELIPENAIQEKSVQNHRGAFAQSEGQAHPSTQTPVVRQAVPDCELAGLKPHTLDAALWARLKIDYERHCYEQTDALVGRQPPELGGVQPAPTVGVTTSDDGTRDKLEGVQPLKPSETTSTVGGAVIKDAATTSAVLNPKLTNTAAASSGAPLDAKSYHERAIAAYHNGDLPLALVDFDLAIQRDPNFEDAYIDRGIVLYRMHERDLAFDDVAQAMRIESSRRTAIPPLPKASPLLK